MQRTTVTVCCTVGAAAAAYNQLDETMRAKRQKLAAIQSFMRLRSVPPFVGQRVVDFYSHSTKFMQPAEEAKMLEDLPSTLRIQLAVVLNERHISKVPMFAQAAPRSLAVLALALQQHTYLPEDMILIEGALNDKLYIVRSGVLHVYVRQSAGNSLWGCRRLATPSLAKSLTQSFVRRANCTSHATAGPAEDSGRSNASTLSRSLSRRLSASKRERASSESHAKSKKDDTLGNHVATIRDGAYLALHPRPCLVLP